MASFCKFSKIFLISVRVPTLFSIVSTSRGSSAAKIIASTSALSPLVVFSFGIGLISVSKVSVRGFSELNFSNKDSKPPDNSGSQRGSIDSSFMACFQTFSNNFSSADA